MSERFFERPILNSPYAYPGRHWELDETGQPTDRAGPPQLVAMGSAGQKPAAVDSLRWSEALRQMEEA